ncbi:hypothetical protein AALP_AA7G153700 [Arabis alpina]|uniref:Uncharacterized protein n=1 Tax=Arabis alpina TaxID=50452 RepID=A0A087GI84_ARAAL|nr:hypothetical protein AALP_AA7G153700 [Arabis alpina]
MPFPLPLEMRTISADSPRRIASSSRVREGAGGRVEKGSIGFVGSKNLEGSRPWELVWLPIGTSGTSVLAGLAEKSVPEVKTRSSVHPGPIITRAPDEEAVTSVPEVMTGSSVYLGPIVTCAPDEAAMTSVISARVPDVSVAASGISVILATSVTTPSPPPCPSGSSPKTPSTL